MTTLDWIVLAILGPSTFLGTLRGPARETMSLEASSFEQMTSKLNPWLPPELAALIRY